MSKAECLARLGGPQCLGLRRVWYGGVLPVYVGDDVTDEDAFKAIAPFGAVSVLVCPSSDKVERPRATHATHTLKDVDDVRAFVDELASACAARPSVRGR